MIANDSWIVHHNELPKIASTQNQPSNTVGHIRHIHSLFFG